jgi:hypothetical protein
VLHVGFASLACIPMRITYTYKSGYFGYLGYFPVKTGLIVKKSSQLGFSIVGCAFKAATRSATFHKEVQLPTSNHYNGNHLSVSPEQDRHSRESKQGGRQPTAPTISARSVEKAPRSPRDPSTVSKTATRSQLRTRYSRQYL